MYGSKHATQYCVRVWKHSPLEIHHLPRRHIVGQEFSGTGSALIVRTQKNLGPSFDQTRPSSFH